MSFTLNAPHTPNPDPKRPSYGRGFDSIRNLPTAQDFGRWYRHASQLGPLG